MALTKVPSNLDSITATTQSASDNSTNVATTAYVTTAVSNLVDGAPSTLNTLNEIAAALNDDAALNTTLTTSIADKLPLGGGTLVGTLTLSYDYPRINLTDTNHDSDYSIINNNGAFGVYDVTNAAYRLQINSSGNLTVSGHITASGTNNIYVGDNGKFTAGGGDDLQIYHDGTNSHIYNNTGYTTLRTAASGGYLYLHGDNVHLRGQTANETLLTAVLNGAVTLYHDNTAKLTTTSTGVEITGTLDVDVISNASGSVHLNDTLYFQDNSKAVFGDSSDLQIYHNGSHSFIDEQGTGGLIVRTGDFYVRNPSDADMIYATSGGAVKLYHNNSEKLETTAYGVSASGTGALKIPVGTTGQRPTAATGQLRFNSTDGRLEVYNGSDWSAVGSTGTGNHSLDTFTGDGSTTAFTLSLSPANEDALTVFIDGAYQEKGDYSLSGNTLTLDTAPLSGEKISVHTIHGAVHDGTAALNQQFTGDGSTTAFTLTSAPGSENNTQIYINGVYQQKTDYTVSGTTLTFDTAPTSGDIIEVNSFTVTNLGNSDQVTEGSSNLYHTSARTISALSGATLTGNLTIQNASSPTLKLVDTTQSSDLRLFAQDSNVGIGTFSNHAVRFYTNSTSRLAIDNSGKVGIGITSSMDSNLHVADGTAQINIEGTSGDATLKLESTGNSYWNMFIDESDARKLKFEDNGNGVALTILRDGNVGIGTTSPSTNLHIGSGTSGNALGVLLNRGATTNFFEANDGTKSAYIGTDNSQNFIKLGSLSNHAVQISQNNAAAIFIDTSKNVGIGNSSPAQKLDVSGHIKLTGSGTYLFGGDNEILAGQDSGGCLLYTSDAADE